MKTFGEYMYYLLSYPFKRSPKSINQWYFYFQVVGSLLDKNMSAFRRARSESTVITCGSMILQEHGKERGLDHYSGESYENFRMRIKLYGEICQMAGTAIGTRMAVESLGFKAVQIMPCYAMDGNRERWAEFYVIITKDIDDAFGINYDIVRREVRQVKKVSAKDNYLFNIESSVENKILVDAGLLIRGDFYPRNNAVINLLNGSWLLDGKYDLSGWCQIPEMLLLDGSWLLDGKYALSEYKEALPDLFPTSLYLHSCAEINSKTESMLIIKKDLWYLNGETLLDGSHSLVASIAYYPDI